MVLTCEWLFHVLLSNGISRDMIAFQFIFVMSSHINFGQPSHYRSGHHPRKVWIITNKHKTAAREDVSRICLPCQQPLELDKSQGWLEDTSVRFLLPYNNISQGNV